MVNMIAVCGWRVIKHLKSGSVKAWSGNRPADRMGIGRDVIHWAVGTPSEEHILLDYDVKQIKSVDLSVKRLLKMIWDFVGVVCLVVPWVVDLELMCNGM